MAVASIPPSMQSFLQTIAAKGATSQSAFVADREGPFWVRARRNALLARWACDLTDDDTQNYLRLLLDVDFAMAQTTETERFLLVKIQNDLMGFGVFLTMDQMKDVLDRFQKQAWLESNQ